ncbi:MAG: DpnI domain-containing protein [Candidatus Acidiferrales bacterium]
MPVQTALPAAGLERYKSNSQRARVATEAWGLENLYCPNCESACLAPSAANMQAVDYSCLNCRAPFQLKAQSRVLAGRIVDAAYSAMVRAIREDRTPNLFALHYEPVAWKVANLILIPHFAFPLSAIEKRKPLSPSARRAGWVGCNILLGAIPLDARIHVVSGGKPAAPADVRAQYARIRPLEKIKAQQRGWTLDVLNVVRSLGRAEFSLRDVYASEKQLGRLHPDNQHVRDKIRQQLQVLRDLGLLQFLGGGEYRVR